MDKNHLSIPMRLAAYRKLMNLNQTQMGERLGVTQSHYSKQESGLKGVSYRNLKCFEEHGGDVFFLITGEHLAEGRLEPYIETLDGGYEKEKMYEILVWAADIWKECLWKGAMTERTGKCIRLLRGYSDEMTVWENIQKAEDYSQEEMARIFDINIKRYRKIEKGETMPDAEILQTLYEKMQYSPLLVMDQKRFYLDELNRVWAALPAEWRQETEAFVRQAEKLVRMSENRRQGRDTGQENRE